MSKTVKIVRKTATPAVVKPRTPKFKVNGQRLPLFAPVNVKVAGERVMRKCVTLVPAEQDGCVLVKTGRRGRPSILPVENIEKVRAL